MFDMYCTFDMFDLFISSHPHILRFLCTCLYPCILASLYPYVRVYLLVSSHPYIFIHPGSSALTCIPASSYPQVCVCLLVISYPHILLSLGSCTLCACWYLRILASSYPQVHVLRVLDGILAFSHPTSSYPQVHVLRMLIGILASSHHHILRFIYSGCLLVSSHPQILRFQCSYFFRKLESDKNNFSNENTSFMEINNGSNNF